MCGIAGFLYLDQNQNQKSLSHNLNLLNLMSNKIKHRGLDAHGKWFVESKGIFLDHRRLSIIDITNKANQPMMSKDKRWTIVFNGEIYNFRSLKEKIEKKNKFISGWDSTGDTEVLLNLFSFYNLEDALQLIEGMYAFALWDNFYNQLILVRDRLGEKPLYYSIDDSAIVFASDISAVNEFYYKNLDIDKSSVRELCKYNYIPAPNTIYKNVKKLEPGEVLIINQKTKEKKIKKYWLINDKDKSFKIKENNIPEKVESLLSDVLKKEIISDVPIGIYLSGGVDSTTLAALMVKKIGVTNLKSFTIINQDRNFDESTTAKKTAKALNLNHHEFEIKKSNLLELIDSMSSVYTEPFADSSQLPTFLLNQKASDFIKVAIGGDGGDELFGGYNRYFLHEKYLKFLNFVPIEVKKIMSRLLLLPNLKTYQNFFLFLKKILFKNYEFKNIEYKIQKFAYSLHQNNYEKFYDNLLSSCPDINSAFFNINLNSKREKINFCNKESFVQSMIFTDIKYYLPDDILCKVDRASMWNGVEVRSPFLHKSLVNFCLNMPPKLLFKNKQNKWILREIIKKYIPNYNNLEKTGFSSPVDDWLRTELKDLFTCYLDERYLKRQGIFEYNFIKKKWNEHINYKRQWGKFLWSFLIFQNWYKKNISK